MQKISEVLDLFINLQVSTLKRLAINTEVDSFLPLVQEFPVLDFTPPFFFLSELVRSNYMPHAHFSIIGNPQEAH